MIYKIFFSFILFLLFSSCSKLNNQQEFSRYYKILNSSIETQVLQSTKAELNKTINNLKSEQSSDLSDFEELLGLYNLKIFAYSKAEDPNLVWRYAYASIKEDNISELSNRHQKASSKCFVFDINKHRQDLDQAYEILKTQAFKYKDTIYDFSDALNTWQKVMGKLSEEEAKKEIALAFKKGICQGVAEYLNEAFCNNTKLSEQELVVLAEQNYPKLLVSAMRNLILSDLMQHAEKEIPDAYNFYANGSFALIKTLKDYVLKNSLKDYLKREVLEKIPKNKSLIAQVVFRGSKNNHMMSLQVGKNIYRIIDNNLGILAFANEEDFLNAFAEYRFFSYLDNKEPFLLIFANYCPEQ